MNVLSKSYFLGRKRQVLFGAFCGAGTAAVLLFGRLGMWAGLAALALLAFPFTPRNQVERLLRMFLVGLYLCLALVYGGRQFAPLAWVGFPGVIVFSAVIFCLRYAPPVTEATQQN